MTTNLRVVASLIAEQAGYSFQNYLDDVQGILEHAILIECSSSNGKCKEEESDRANERESLRASKKST